MVDAIIRERLLRTRTNRENRVCNIIYNIYCIYALLLRQSFVRADSPYELYLYIYVILNVIYLRSSFYWPFADDVARYHYDWYDIRVVLKLFLGLNGLRVTSPILFVSIY